MCRGGGLTYLIEKLNINLLKVRAELSSARYLRACNSAFLFVKNRIAIKENTNIALGVFLGLTIFNMFNPDMVSAALPWEGPLEELEESITGPVAKGITAIVVCVCGVMIAMGEGGASGRLALRLIFGLALAIGFMQILSMF